MFLDPITFRNWRLVKYAISFVTGAGIIVLLFGFFFGNPLFVLVGVLMASPIVVLPILGYYARRRREQGLEH